jgi:hypothetical protein
MREWSGSYIKLKVIIYDGNIIYKIKQTIILI